MVRFSTPKQNLASVWSDAHKPRGTDVDALLALVDDLETRLSAALATQLEDVQYIVDASAIAGVAGSVGQRVGYLYDFDATGAAATAIGGMVAALRTQMLGKLGMSGIRSIQTLNIGFASGSAADIGNLGTQLANAARAFVIPLGESFAAAAGLQHQHRVTGLSTTQLTITRESTGVAGNWRGYIIEFE